MSARNEFLVEREAQRQRGQIREEGPENWNRLRGEKSYRSELSALHAFSMAASGKQIVFCVVSRLEATAVHHQMAGCAFEMGLKYTAYPNRRDIGFPNTGGRLIVCSPSMLPNLMGCVFDEVFLP